MIYQEIFNEKWDKYGNYNQYKVKIWVIIANILIKKFAKKIIAGNKIRKVCLVRQEVNSH